MLHITKHAQRRMDQRSIRAADLDLFFLYGSEFHDGYIITDKDAETAEAALRKMIARIQKLKGKVVISERDCAITAYHPSKERSKVFLRKFR